MNPDEPRLYSEFASWFHLLAAPADYVEEAALIRSIFFDAGLTSGARVLELGCGGGNNASHLKSSFNMTLTDLSSSMLDQSRRINPECEHLPGDMRSMRLGRVFDAVLAHDAICCLTTERDLRLSMETAFMHCREGGVALFMPDVVRERLHPGVHHGGHDGFPGEARSLRYIEWTFDPEPRDATYTVDFAYLLRDGSNPVRVEHDTHFHGLFSIQEWIDWIAAAGFLARLEEDPCGRIVFVGTRKS